MRISPTSDSSFFTPCITICNSNAQDPEKLNIIQDPKFEQLLEFEKRKYWNNLSVVNMVAVQVSVAELHSHFNWLCQLFKGLSCLIVFNTLNYV
jgi:hypothetical protein